ncbi:MAG: hypothetical protein AB8B69_00820 [Chitinophagales bacterium]
MKRLFFLLTIVCSFAMTSCFNIIEEVAVNRNGSGTYKTTVDMSQMMGMIAAFMPDSVKQMTGEVERGMTSSLDELKTVKGISNISTNSDGDYIYSVSYTFENVKALNEAISTSKEDDKFFGAMGSTYEIKGKKLYRKTYMDPDEDSELFGDTELDMEQLKGFMGMLNTPTYKVIYHLPKKVKKLKVEGTEAKYEKDANRVEIEYDLFKMIGGENVNIEHFLKY